MEKKMTLPPNQAASQRQFPLMHSQKKIFKGPACKIKKPEW